MVVSDIIPGFSGGIALTFTGIIHDVWGKWKKIIHPVEKNDRLNGIIFYLVFVTGSISGTLAFSQIVNLMLSNIPTITFYFFLTVSFISIFIYIKINKANFAGSSKTSKKVWVRLVALLVGIGIIVGLMITTYMVEGRQTEANLHSLEGQVGFEYTKITILMFFAGMFASFAMVTPGMSGALVILSFGVYGHIYGGMLVNPLMHWDILLLYMAGTVIGTVVAVVLLGRWYEKYTTVLTWIFMGTLSVSWVAMILLFDVWIPVEKIRWIYIVISVGVAASLGGLVYKFVNPNKFS